MFAAAAIVSQTIFNAALAVAKWLATKAFIVACLTIVLPWVLKGFFMWGFNWIATYGREIAEYLMSILQSQVSSMGMDIDITLVGPGGYIAQMVGLPEYASIIFTGWGIYWYIAVFAKASPLGRVV